MKIIHILSNPITYVHQLIYFRIDTAGTSNNEVNEEASKEDSSKFEYIVKNNLIIIVLNSHSLFL